MLTSLVAALVAAFCYGLGAVMQAMAVRASSRRPALEAAGVRGQIDPGLLIRMLRQWPFIVSLIIDLIGFAGQVVALRRLPIFEVQAIIAANLAVTAVFGAWLMHLVLGWREWTAVGAVVVGVGLLGSSAGGEGARTVGPTFRLGLIVALAVIAVIGMAAARLPGSLRTPILGALAGLGYGVLAVCARILPSFSPSTLVKSPAAYTLAAAGIVSFLLYASALESGSVTVATASVILVETVPPAAVGVLLLGDSTRPGMTGVAIAGFVMALLGAIALARFGGEPGERPAHPAALPEATPSEATPSEVASGRSAATDVPPTTDLDHEARSASADRNGRAGHNGVSTRSGSGNGAYQRWPGAEDHPGPVSGGSGNSGGSGGRSLAEFAEPSAKRPPAR